MKGTTSSETLIPGVGRGAGAIRRRPIRVRNGSISNILDDFTVHTSERSPRGAGAISGHPMRVRHGSISNIHDDFTVHTDERRSSTGPSRSRQAHVGQMGHGSFHNVNLPINFPSFVQRGNNTGNSNPTRTQNRLSHKASGSKSVNRNDPPRFRKRSEDRVSENNSGQGQRPTRFVGSRGVHPEDYGGAYNLPHGPNNADRNKNKRNYPKCGFRKLETMLSKQPEEILLDVMGMVQDFKQFADSNLTPDSVVLLIHIFASISHSKYTNNIAKILMIFSSDSYIEQLQRFIVNLPFQDTKDRDKNRYFWNKIHEFWNNLYVVCNKFIDLCPQRASDILPNIIKRVVNTIPSFEKEFSYPIPDTIKNDYENLQLKLVEFECKKQTIASKCEIEEQEPEDDFRTLPIYPTTDELMSSEGTIIRKNRVTGRYDSVEQYLDIQFRLLREDFISPLRDGVSEYMNSKGTKRFSNVKIYKRVTYITMERVQSQLGAKVQVMEPGKLKNVERTKRFMFGSLVCFTSDDFNTIIFGRVIDRNIVLLKQGLIVVGFDAGVELQPDVNYTMIECMVFFEPYFHVLTALQNLDIDDFPLKRYLVDVVNDSEPPDYIQDATIFKYCDANANDIDLRTIRLPVTRTYNWPHCETLNLNESQCDALKSALNKKFCIIQGPPGTGKTYLGLKIAKTLLANETVWFDDGPMLVICYTNHALDQFLEGLLSQTKSIVRIGGQSKNENLSLFNLKNLRVNARRNNDALRATKNELLYMGEKLQRWNINRNALLNCTSVINFNEFINDQLFDTSWFTSASPEVLIQWLLEEANNMDTDDLCNQVLVEIEKMKRMEEHGSDSVEEENYFDMGLKNNIDLDETIYTVECLPNELVSLEGLAKLISRRAAELNVIEDKMSFKYVEALKGFRNARNHYKYLEIRLKELSLGVFNHQPEYLDLQKPFNMTPVDRWKLYAQCLVTYKNKVDIKIKELDQEYRICYKQYEDIRDIHDIMLMKQKLVIGMTTTGAARLQRTLQALKCPIVIVEEAAEVLEAHVIAALTSNCQHLILIGDHKQLRPTTADYHLDKHYNLGISLFERMIMNNFNCTTLNVQHRMRPEIARLVSPTIYDILENHPSVSDYEKIKGVDKSLYFISHTNREKESDDNSKENIFEAKYLIQLAKYLVMNGYKPEQITILALYSGQLFKLLNERRNLPRLNSVKITILDNYQGEENDIILLSLVRNNENNIIGFLNLENRVCVSLSRAKQGMYIMGNIDMLCHSSKIWPKIRTTLEDLDSVGPALALRCQNHREQITLITNLEDFNKVPEGGCMKMCEQLMDCGHTCLQMCHIVPHDEYKCNQPCLKILCEFNHGCPKRCSQACENCLVPKEATLPCGHTHNIPCFMNAEDVLCPTLIPATLNCGHKIENKPCCKDLDTVRCPFPCDARIEPCGHACAKQCHIKNDPDHSQYQCTKDCEKPNAGCKDPKNPSHKCRKVCCETCSECSITVRKHRTVCPHVFDVKCSEDVDVLDCKKPCKKKLLCGHPCKKKCFEECGDCQQLVVKIIEECGHNIKIKCCDEPVRRHCTNVCSKLLTCGHKCPLRCKDPCAKAVCKQLITKASSIAPCAHKLVVPCNEQNDPDLQTMLKYCTERCNTVLECGHTCKGTCGECSQGRLHKICQEKCNQIFVCGHACELPCSAMCQPCIKPCVYKCKHSQCKQKCGVPCTRCVEKCQRKCEHGNCTRKCYEKCNKQSCIEPCQKCLGCGHQCIGFCGEPCPKLCRICDNEEVTEIFLGNEADENAIFVYLEECGHTIESSGLDQWFQMEVENQSISMKCCPKCKTPITLTLRYSDYIKTTFRSIQMVKKKLYGNINKNENDKKAILSKCTTLLRENGFGTVTRSLAISVMSDICKQLKGSLGQQAIRSYSSKIKILEEISLSCSEYVIRNDEANLMLNKYVIFLIKFIQNVPYMSNQIINDYKMELKRLTRIVQLAKIMDASSNCKSFTEFNDCYKKAFSCFQYNDDQDCILKRALEVLNRISRSGLNITNQERQEILSAMNLGKGHWFKCPKGHVYAIGECGGAMEVGICPDCGSAIGGTSHALNASNALAPEMDGAQAPAFPTINDIRNYRL